LTPAETFELRPGYTISRVICGGWQLAGGHGTVDRKTAVADFAAFCKAGIFTFDCADIYTGVEDLIGEFRTAFAHKWGADALKNVKVHTKFVPNLEILPVITKGHVRDAIDQSLRRLRTERLDLVQFHWWDYNIPGCVQAALWLKELQDEGKINLLGATNFDTPHTAELLDAGIPLVSMQVQYSLLDERPRHGLIDRCQHNNVYLLCYGSVAGGFLTDQWLGRDEPVPPFENRSLTKYKLIIDDFGGWTLFQQLLRTLREIADRHGKDIATVASRAILDRPRVGAVIVGARNRSHLAANLEIMELQLTQADLIEINSAIAQRRGPEGDTFTLERDRNGPHGSIMKYNLNEPAT
jgi:aryl-alcohol dehydrogenase-like predicted oxidoreductase